MAEQPRLEDLRLLSDGRSALLLTPSAEVVWWCTPRFDSKPTWWSLVVPHGGSLQIADAVPVTRSEAIADAVAMTTVRVGDRTLEVVDGLVDGELIRITLDGDNAHAVSVSPGGTDNLPVSEAAAKLSVAAADFQRHAAVQPQSRHRERVTDAFAVMSALQDRTSGAVIAAATASVPEARGADRQFDYRYSWLRDASLSASVAALHGRLSLAKQSLAFIEQLGDRVFSSPVFTVDGEPAPREQCVPLEGWDGSTPIRFGNEAREQVQFDALGFVVEAFSTYTSAGGRLTRRAWRLVSDIADRCCDPEPQRSNGIWEFREARQFVSADIGRWVALDRALRIGRHRRPWARRSRWAEARDAARARVLGVLGADGSLPQSYDDDTNRFDASALLVVMFGMLSGDDPRAAALVDRHLRELGDGVHMRRYSAMDDGFHGREATFVPCSWWAVTALSAIGRHDAADERCDALCRELPRLLAEEFDPATGESRGNLPLVWSHAEAARALHVLRVR